MKLGALKALASMVCAVVAVVLVWVVFGWAIWLMLESWSEVFSKKLVLRVVHSNNLIIYGMHCVLTYWLINFWFCNLCKNSIFCFIFVSLIFLESNNCLHLHIVPSIALISLDVYQWVTLYVFQNIKQKYFWIFLASLISLAGYPQSQPSWCWHSSHFFTLTQILNEVLYCL